MFSTSRLDLRIDTHVADQLKILNLNCANCGGVLEIQSDMDRFACGYCGSAQIVERRGGTVALRLVVDAVARVQVGTDRTAAELALVRLEKERAGVNAQWQAASADFGRRNSSSSTPAILGMVCALIVAVIALEGVIGSASTGSADLLVVSIVFIGGGLAAFIFCMRLNAEVGRRYAAKRSELWAPYAQRIDELDKLMKKKREMVDDS